MVTASHLPPDTNGIKLCREKAIPLSGDKGLPALERLVTAMNAGTGCTTPGSYKKGDLTDSYIDMVAGCIWPGTPSPLQSMPAMAWQARKSGGFFCRSKTLPRLRLTLNRMAASPIMGQTRSFCPQQTSSEDLVRYSGADFGVAFDGDADRCIFVDETGARISADLVTALIAEHYLREVPGATFLYDLRLSRIVAETVLKQGGKGIRCRVGHAFIKEQMRQENAVFAGDFRPLLLP